MKLNENGDFCLLYIEPSDEKQSLFATIGEQQKPVVLMLPAVGQPRSRLFQRPEDFIDLKHIRRQSGVSIVFLTAGSELLAQMAARYGFPSYPSIDDFADFLAHGRRLQHDDDEAGAYAPALRRVRTGPLMPSTAIAQLAALRRPLTTRPLAMQAEIDPWTALKQRTQPEHQASEPWTGHEKSIQPGRKASEPWTSHEKSIHLKQKSGEQWFNLESSEQPEMAGELWIGRETSGLSAMAHGQQDGLQSGPPEGVSELWGGCESNGLDLEYSEAFHEALTMPIGGAAAMVWPLPGDEVSPVLSVQPPDSVRDTPVGTGRVYGYQSPAPVRGMVTPNTDSPAPRPLSEIPRRRSAHLSDEPHSRHPGWRAEEHMFEPGAALSPGYQRATPQKPKDAPRPAHGRYDSSPVTTFGTHGLASTHRTAETPTGSARPLAGAPGIAPDHASSGVSGGHTAARGTSAAHPMPSLSTEVLMSKGMQKRGSIWPLLVILSLLIITGGALGSFVAIARVAPSVPTLVLPVGSIAFVSSEQLNENTSQGIDDQVRVSLHSLGTPAPGKSYYAWLLGDSAQSESQSIALGKLNVSNGSASLFYAGDGLHTNLLQITSRFLVTEENGDIMPLMPSPDTGTWRYYGSLPTLPDANDAHHFSFLNHLRHLLADEPGLDELELPGGLNNWFTRNTQELIQLTSNARDRWQNSHNLLAVRNQGIQILSYLDGMSFVVQDLPAASTNVQISLDTHQASLGLLNVRGTTQNPPGYLTQIVYHLNGLLNAPGSPGNVRSIVKQILPTLSDVTAWLQKLRNDDKNLLAMTDARLDSPAALSLLDDMVLQASNAYSGNTDPSTGQSKPGVSWLHQQLQSIATININTYVIQRTPVPEVAPSSKSGPAFLQPFLKFWREWERIL